MAQKSAGAEGREKAGGFTEAEKAAMKERAREMKAEAKGAKTRADGEKLLLEQIEKMPEAEATMARRLHEIVMEAAPELMPKTWYGMPAYAKDGKVLCFFQTASKFGSRYSTFGFNDVANLDEGDMWATSFALKSLTPAAEKRIAALVKKAVG